MAQHRFRTVAIVGAWRPTREQACQDALRARLARPDAASPDGLCWRVPGKIERAVGRQRTDRAARAFTLCLPLAVKRSRHERAAEIRHHRQRRRLRSPPEIGGEHDGRPGRPRRADRLDRGGARVRHGRAAGRLDRARRLRRADGAVVAARRQGAPQSDDRHRLGQAAAAARRRRSTSASPRSPACGGSGR